MAFFVTISFLKMGAVLSSKTVVPTYQTVESHNSEGLNMSLQLPLHLVQPTKNHGAKFNNNFCGFNMTYFIKDW
jgi:hypothetical protein